MGMLKKINTSMVSALLLFTIIASVSGVCDDDMVPIGAVQLPAEWNLGTIPHLFLNSEHLRGVLAVSNTKIIGLDTVTTSFNFCPVTMTIYGNMTAGCIRIVGGYTSNLDYLTKGHETFGHGHGEFNVTFEKVEMKNMVVPLRYSSITKKLQVDDIQYEITENIMSPNVTGFETDHVLNADELPRLEQSNSLPFIAEFMRSVINSKVQKGILLAAVKTLFVSAVDQ